MSLATLTLVKANKQQTVESRRRNFDEWNRGLSIEEYLGIHDTLDLYQHASDNKFATWVLISRDDTESLNFLCACETYRRAGLVSTSAGVQDVTAYAVASVYTPTVNRKQGYARHMLRLLHHVIGVDEGLPSFPADWGPPPARDGFGDGKFSILYSDVGPNFYAVCGPSPTTPGWVVQNPTEVVWKLDGIAESPPSGECKLLKESDLEGVLAEDAALIKQEMSAATGPCCSFTGNIGVNNYLVQRSIIYGKLRNRPPRNIWGVALHHDSQPLSFILWAYDTPALAITRLRADPESLPALLADAKKVALQEGLEEVVAWGVPESLQQSYTALGGTQRTRTNHLPSVHVYDAHGETFEWIHSERFSWC